MQTEHKINREYAGKGELSTIQPTCSCGWKGKPIPAWNNYQHTVVKEQISKHLLDSKKEN